MATGFVVGNIFFALLPMVMAPILGEITAEGLPIIPFTHAPPFLGLYVFLFSTALILADECALSAAKTLRKKPSAFHQRAPEPKFSEFQTVFFYAIVSMLVVFFNSGKLSGAHWAAHADTGFLGSIVSVIALSLRAYVFALSIVILRHKRSKTLLLLFIFTVTDIVLTGNRISALYLAFAIFFSGAFSRRSLTLMGISCLPLGYFLAVLYPAFRGVVWSKFGGFSGFSEALIYVWRNGLPTAFETSNIYKLFEAANVVIFQYIFQTFGHSHAFLDGSTVVVKPLTFFIPRALFPDKPLGLGTQLGDQIFGIDGLSLNSLLMGEFYANFGWYAPLAIFILATALLISLKSIRAFRERQYQLALFVLAFSSWRHEFNYIFFSFFLLIFLIPFVQVTARIRVRKKATHE